MNFIKVCATSAALLFLCSCESDKVTLAFNTQNVPAQTFFLDASLNVIMPTDSSAAKPESMETHIKVQSTSNLTVSYDDGSARFEMKVDSVDYKSDKRSVEEFRYIERYLAVQHFQFKLAGDGVISDLSMDESVAPTVDDLDLVKLFLKAQPLLPGKPVSVGETWERPVEIPGKGGATTVYKSFTFEDLYVHDGLQMAKIAMNMKYREVPDTTSDVRMESDDFIVGSGSVLFDVTHGVVTSANMEISGHMTVVDMVSKDTIPQMYVMQKIKMRGEL